MEPKQNTGGGKAPWGYQFTKDDQGRRTIEPTPEGRTWVPRIFGWFAEEVPTSEIAQRLESAGVRSGAPDGLWGNARLGSMLKVPAYGGLYEHAQLGLLLVEPVVPLELANKAMRVLASRARGGRSKTPQSPVLRNLRCGHPECPGKGSWPMYKVDGRYYRCFGRGPRRQGCGAPMIRMSVLDSLIVEDLRDLTILAWNDGSAVRYKLSETGT